MPIFSQSASLYDSSLLFPRIIFPNKTAFFYVFSQTHRTTCLSIDVSDFHSHVSNRAKEEEGEAEVEVEVDKLEQEATKKFHACELDIRKSREEKFKTNLSLWRLWLTS